MRVCIISTLLILIISCSSISVYDDSQIISSFMPVKNEFVKQIEEKNKENIDKFFMKGFKNDLILKHINDIDLSDINIFLPDKTIEVVNNKVRTLLLINYGTNTKYIYLEWIRDNDWKISNVYEKQN